MPKILGRKPDLKTRYPKGNNQSPENMLTIDIPLSYWSSDNKTYPWICSVEKILW